jgi:hypothetical protein
MVFSFCHCQLQLCITHEKKLIGIVLFFRENNKSTAIFAKMLTKTVMSGQFSRMSLKMANFRISFYPFLLSIVVLFCRVVSFSVSCMLFFVGCRLSVVEC